MHPDEPPAPDASGPAPGPDDEHERLARLANLLFQAARNGDAELLQEAAEGGAPPDLANQNGDTLLMLAAYHGHERAVRVLLQAGASVDQLNDRGQTPLGGATFKGFTDVVEALLEFGADPQAGSPPAITVAVMFDRDDLLALFDARAAGSGGADPGAR
jgi:hypothetical protein